MSKPCSRPVTISLTELTCFCDMESKSILFRLSKKFGSAIKVWADFHATSLMPLKTTIQLQMASTALGGFLKAFISVMSSLLRSSRANLAASNAGMASARATSASPFSLLMSMVCTSMSLLFMMARFFFSDASAVPTAISFSSSSTSSVRLIFVQLGQFDFGFFYFVYADQEAILLIFVLAVFPLQYAHVGANVVEIIFRCGVIFASELGRELVAVVFHALVGHDHVGYQERGGHGKKGLFGPRHEPVDDGVVDQSGKIAASGAQSVAYRGHGQHYVQIAGAVSDGLVSYLADDGFFFFVWVEGRHHSRSEHVVDELEEALLGHMLIAEQEDYFFVFDAKFVVENFEVVSECGLVVAAAKLDLEYVIACGERGQTCQTLLATATDSD
ncbi:hypothetical protein BpHYR1_015874 [Brachionus plicatilis]|uniref:Uncharacterized protein n=1 Tax=Brachionus plicatilis TaxID=10195 RepID=A0A3M7QWW0_BRAPC|nr:hypothetical protein BpHYR1_015874 [Brachionus plicatilis]